MLYIFCNNYLDCSLSTNLFFPLLLLIPNIPAVVTNMLKSRGRIVVLSPVATILFDTASFITASEVIFSFTSVFNPIPLLTDVVGDSF